MKTSLYQVEADIADLRMRLNVQRQRIEEFERRGVESSSARELLNQYEKSVREGQRNLILNAMGVATSEDGES